MGRRQTSTAKTSPTRWRWFGRVRLMLDFLGHGQGVFRQAHDAIVKAIETVLKQGTRTPDLGGTASTTTMGKALAAQFAL